ncbi:hypothetical protein EIP91_008216 [Steccherinum ochraceum]|uniref:Membrane protein BRI3 n=1 Tax=Steccherinum ochraceum TaxID=92696 RepID=A0A4R0RL71_9APHY|nr:hypothetical protein EIP91_008216 [Steccherinum ochraceum]
MQAKSSTDGPPSYENAVGQTATPDSVVHQSQQYPKDVKARPNSYSSSVAPPPGLPTPGPSPIPSHQATTVYNYVNPRTGERVVSLLPPDHPQMICLQEGQHRMQTKFGVLGIIAAVVWFPFGIGLCLLDRRVRCKRCGLVLDNGVCG